jgi:hypothetical protein
MLCSLRQLFKLDWLVSGRRQAGVKDSTPTIHDASLPMANYMAVVLVTSASSVLAPIGKDNAYPDATWLVQTWHASCLIVASATPGPKIQLRPELARLGAVSLCERRG